jgi:hypothetical protein
MKVAVIVNVMSETVVNRHLNEYTSTIVNLLTDQIAFANVLVVKKTDQITKHQDGELKAILNKLNPKVQLIESQFGRIDPARNGRIWHWLLRISRPAAFSPRPVLDVSMRELSGGHFPQQAEQVTLEFRECLCSEPELKHLAAGGRFNDPFPVWE